MGFRAWVGELDGWGGRYCGWGLGSELVGTVQGGARVGDRVFYFIFLLIVCRCWDFLDTVLW